MVPNGPLHIFQLTKKDLGSLPMFFSLGQMGSNETNDCPPKLSLLGNKTLNPMTRMGLNTPDSCGSVH